MQNVRIIPPKGRSFKKTCSKPSQYKLSQALQFPTARCFGPNSSSVSIGEKTPHRFVWRIRTLRDLEPNALSHVNPNNN